ncbi:hypothetical protein BV392_09675, partial [Rhodovulum sulfidophilum]
MRRYQRDRPGELIRRDIKRLGRFERPGHRGAIGSSPMGDAIASLAPARAAATAGRADVAVDDAIRLAYVEGLPDGRKATNTGFLLRALRWLRTQGI